MRTLWTVISSPHVAVALMTVALLPFVIWAARDNTAEYFPWPLRIGVLGSAASIVGIVVTLVQLLATKHAATLAQAASESAGRQTTQAIRDFRNRQTRAAIAVAKRLLSEAQRYAEGTQFSLAAIRLDDLALHLSESLQLPQEAERFWRNAVASMRNWAERLRSPDAEKHLRYQGGNWRQLAIDVSERLAVELDLTESGDESDGL